MKISGTVGFDENPFLLLFKKKKVREDFTGFEREVSIRGCPWVSLLTRFSQTAEIPALILFATNDALYEQHNFSELDYAICHQYVTPIICDTICNTISQYFTQLGAVHILRQPPEGG